MKDMWETERKMLIYLPAGRVFTVVQNNNLDVIIANKDFTKFRTLDQLLATKGETAVVAVKDTGLFGRVDTFYKLPSGQILHSAVDDRTDRSGNAVPFTSIGDLKEYEAACKKQHADYLKRQDQIKKMQESENNEKYLEF